MPLSATECPFFHQVRAADEKEEANRSFNPWRTGTDPVEPRIARDFFVRMSLPLAAEHELKVFVSNPFVYSHLVHVVPGAQRGRSRPRRRREREALA